MINQNNNSKKINVFVLHQLQLLVDDSARLQETYPGGNAEQISQQQALVVENWGILQEKTAHRREDLQAALEMFRFLASVRTPKRNKNPKKQGKLG